MMTTTDAKESIQPISKKQQNHYKIKAWVDVQDQSNIWRLARIKKIQDTLITVNFDGWSDKFNITICIHSPRLAPPRLYSKGYTGQIKFPLRDSEFSMSMLKLVFFVPYK